MEDDRRAPPYESIHHLEVKQYKKPFFNLYLN